ncbi:hypothetical protein [Thalassospira marina]|nr:hypothetical protein [Thalassospira marina]
MASGNPVVDGANQKGGVLATAGWTANVSGILLAGDYIGLGDGADARMYRVLRDVDSDAGGKASIDIWPRINVPPGNLAPIEIDNPQTVFYLAGKIPEMESLRDGVDPITFSAVEDLR